MKTQIMKALSSKVRNSSIIVVLFCLLSMNFIPASAHAQEGDQPNANPVEIKYIGTKDGKMCFQVDFDNQNEDSYNIAIKDQEGFTFFKDQFSDKKFSKKFLVDTNELGSSTIVFTFRSQKSKQPLVYQVNTSTRVVNDVVVTKL